LGGETGGGKEQRISFRKGVKLGKRANPNREVFRFAMNK